MRPDGSRKPSKKAPNRHDRAIVVSVLTAVSLSVVGIAVLLGERGDAGRGSAGTSTQPAGVVGGKGGGILANVQTPKGNAPTLEIYADFQCDLCGQFEKVMGSMLTTMAQAGDVKLVFHTLSFVDINLKNDSSSRSANAVACAADAGRFLEYHAAVFAAQPAEEGAGYTDAQLTEFAGTSGITGEDFTTWQTCETSSKYAQYVTDVQVSGEKAGVFDTPTVKLNGENITATLSTPDALSAQIKAATT